MKLTSLTLMRINDISRFINKIPQPTFIRHALQSEKY